ncbi:MAG: NAD(+)/NADH kinase [Alphaproteobacteria bacterium]|nr:NAD(+)/NADH kinase [Alphaproteobacteria bacterium]
MIVADARNPAALALREELVRRLGEQGVDGLVLVVGGDGFLLHTVAERGTEATYMGLNAGRIGFLMNDVDSLDDVVARLKTGAWRTWTFPLLRADLTLDDGTTQTVHAVNDVALERSTGQTAHLALQIDGRAVVDTLVADGIIFATALGSTAYAFSAGGPACHPSLPAFVVTPVAPHHPRLSSFLLPADATARVEVLASHRRPVRAVTDGQTLDHVLAAELRLDDRQVRFAWLEGHDFTSTMVTKILRP